MLFWRYKDADVLSHALAASAEAHNYACIGRR